MKKLSVAAETAQAIKKELNDKFPDIKFSVKSDTWDFGTAVKIDWEDGPTKFQVYEVVDKYQYGKFNPENDCYEMTNKRNDIPQVKYVVGFRRMTQAVESLIMATLRINYDYCKGKNRNDFVYEVNKDMKQLIKEVFDKTDFSILHK
jgi:hypothetical protein